MNKETRRAGVVEFEDLDPCAVYIVSVTIGKHKVGRYDVGPYYIHDDVQHPLLNNDQNPNLVNNSEIKTVTSSKDRAVFQLGPVCAKMVILHLHEKKPGFNDSSPWLDLEKTTISNVTKISPNTKGGTEVVVENLKPCTLYSVDIELSFGDKRSPTDEEDFIKDRIFDFYTMPDNKDDSQSRQKSRRESNVVENVVKSGDTAKMPIECLSDNDPIVLALVAKEDEKQILHIAIGVSTIVILTATILACSLTFCRRHRGQLEMKEKLQDSPSFNQGNGNPFLTRTIPIETEPENNEQTVVLVKYADLSKI